MAFDSLDYKSVLNLLRGSKIYWILLIALVLRLGMCLYVCVANPDAAFCPDSYSYHALGVNLLQNHSFSLSGSAPFKPNLFRPPGYPLMIAIIYAIFGIRPVFVIIFQIVLSVLTIAMIYKLGMILFNRRSGLLAASLLTIEPTSIYYSNVLTAETLFTFVLVCFVFLMVRIAMNVEEHTINKVLIASSLLAIAALIKYVSYYLSIPVGIGLLVYLSRNVSLRKTVVCFFVFALAQLLIIGSWQMRNYTKTGHWELTATPASDLFLRAASVIAAKNGISFDEAWQQLRQNLLNDGEFSELNEIERFNVENKRGLEIIKEYPWTYAKLYAGGILKMFAEPGMTSVMILFGLHQPGSGLLGKIGFNRYLLEYVIDHKVLLIFNSTGLAYLILVYASFVIGLKSSFNFVTKENHFIFISILFLLGLIFYFALMAQTESYSRFRSPIMPYIILFAGYGLYHGLSVQTGGIGKSKMNTGQKSQ